MSLRLTRFEGPNRGQVVSVTAWACRAISLLWLALHACLAMADGATNPVQTQGWFTYMEKAMFGRDSPIRLEVLATEPSQWNGKIVVINHGSTGRGHGANGYDESRIKTPVRFAKLGSAWVAKGYRVFVLMRKGRGNSEGSFTEEDARTCAWSDQMRGVDEAMAQLDQFIDWLRIEYKVDKIIVMGHSRGGFLASHYSARHPEKVDFAVNISGGWTTVCEAKNRMTHRALNDSAGQFKRQAWIYSSKDSYFSDSDLDDYAQIAAKTGIDFIKLDTLTGDGHAFATANPKLWVDRVERSIAR